MGISSSAILVIQSALILWMLLRILDVYPLLNEHRNYRIQEYKNKNSFRQGRFLDKWEFIALLTTHFQLLPFVLASVPWSNRIPDIIQVFGFNSMFHKVNSMCTMHATMYECIKQQWCIWDSTSIIATDSKTYLNLSEAVTKIGCRIGYNSTHNIQEFSSTGYPIELFTSGFLVVWSLGFLCGVISILLLIVSVLMYYFETPTLETENQRKAYDQSHPITKPFRYFSIMTRKNLEQKDMGIPSVTFNWWEFYSFDLNYTYSYRIHLYRKEFRDSRRPKDMSKIEIIQEEDDIQEKSVIREDDDAKEGSNSKRNSKNEEKKDENISNVKVVFTAFSYICMICFLSGEVEHLLFKFNVTFRSIYISAIVLGATFLIVIIIKKIWPGTVGEFLRKYWLEILLLWLRVQIIPYLCTSFAIMGCIKSGNDSVMQVAPNIVCWSGKHWLLYIAGFSMVVRVTGSIPTLLLLSEADHERFIEPIPSYEMWFWIYACAIAAFNFMFPEEITARLIFTIFVLQYDLAWLLKKQPYKHIQVVHSKVVFSLILIWSGISSIICYAINDKENNIPFWIWISGVVLAVPSGICLNRYARYLKKNQELKVEKYLMAPDIPAPNATRHTPRIPAGKHFVPTGKAFIKLHDEEPEELGES